MKKILLVCTVAAIAFSNIYCNKEHLETTGPASEEVINANMQPNQTYQYNLGTYGANEPVITKQSAHYKVSSIERTEGGNYVYNYLPAQNFTGNDEVIIRVLRESNGVDPLRTAYIKFKFSIQQETQQP